MLCPYMYLSGGAQHKYKQVAAQVAVQLLLLLLFGAKQINEHSHSPSKLNFIQNSPADWLAPIWQLRVDCSKKIHFSLLMIINSVVSDRACGASERASEQQEKQMVVLIFGSRISYLRLLTLVVRSSNSSDLTRADLLVEKLSVAC